MKKLLFCSTIILMAACARNKNMAKNNSAQMPATEDAKAMVTKTVSGIVKEVVMGKDGYTAKIETAEKENFFVVISHSNLQDPMQYKMVKVAESLTVKGDYWEMNNENHMAVRVIL